MIENIYSNGLVEISIFDHNKNKIVDKINLKNTILTVGKTGLARALTNNIGSSFQYYVAYMNFGEGGEENNIPRVVTPDRTSLFNLITSTASLTVTPQWSSQNPKNAVFSATLGTSDANGKRINEAALKMANGDLFSMITFGGLTKTSSLSFTLNWTIIFS